jgi:NDP-sugar pyrophosphorylase family protein
MKSRMQIVVPMSGFGERFRRAGYSMPKPLIEIDGKPIIAHVIDLFPGETDFVFICNRDHLDDPSFGMAETLHKYCPTGRVLAIAPHKLGPIHAVLQAADLIDRERPVVVNYCDFTCFWDWTHFKEFVRASACDGAIPAYRGFHPHSLGTTNYAYIREQGGWISDIQEKQPFTENRMREYASTGTYYFRSGGLLLGALQRTVEAGLNVGGEYYVSLAYKPLFEDKAAVAVYPIQHFMQWGTPEDVAEYRQWSEAFRLLGNAERAPVALPGNLVVPMAGLGQRFADDGWKDPKPLIGVSGQPMVVQAASDLPVADESVFVLRTDMPDVERIEATLAKAIPRSRFVELASVTEGQAVTALAGVAALAAGDDRAVTFGTCDNGLIYDARRLAELLGDDEVDVIVWVRRGHAHAIRHPRMYGWVAAEGDVVTGVSVKKPLAEPATDPIVVGTFTFRRSADFKRCFERMTSRGGRVNGEYYLDTCIEDALALGLRCRLFEIDAWLNWGTPDDLRTFEYWQSCFHKWPGHSYRLENDRHATAAARPQLEARYAAIVPELPDARA